MLEGHIVVVEDTGSTQTCAVIGYPVAHSLSPLLHTTGYQALGMCKRWRYTRCEVGGPHGPSLADFLAGKGSTMVGLSVTMPLKEQAAKLAATGDDVVQITGIANTLVRTAQGWRASNTDVQGVTGALQRAQVSRIRRGAVIGGGATARSAVVALASLGAQDLVFITRRDLDPPLIELLNTLGMRWQRTAFPMLGENIWEVDVVVNTLPGDLESPAVPLAQAGPGGQPVPLVASPGAAVLDVAYHGRPTWVETAWTAAGFAWAPGWWMLAEQAFVQFKAMTGAEAPREAMWSRLEDAVAEQSASES